MLNRPEFQYHGVTKSAAEPAVRTVTISQSAHILLSHILAERGTDKPTYMDVNGFISEYGSATLNNHIHDTHQLDYLVEHLNAQGAAVVERIVLPDAKKAMLRISIELIPSNIPIYKFDEYWRPRYAFDEHTGQYDRIIIGEIGGYRAVLHVGTDIFAPAYRGFGLGNVGDYRPGTTRGFDGKLLQGTLDGTFTSKLYPIMDIELQDYGEFGNAVTISISRPTFDMLSQPSAMSQVVIREKDQPMVNLDGIAETLFGITPVADSDVSLARAILLSYTGGYNQLIGNIHTYDDAIAEVVEKLVNGGDGVSGEDAIIAETIRLNEGVGLTYPHKVPYTKTPSSKFQFNILTGIHNDRNHHLNGDLYNSENFNGTLFTDGYFHNFTGGSDGYPLDAYGNVDKLKLLRLYDETVRNKFEGASDPNSVYRNLARLPFTVWYDSGYAMLTKLAAFNMLKSRPEVTLIQSAWSVADYGSVVDPVPPKPQISCDGATNTTGCVDITEDGLYDLRINGVLVLENVTAAQILAFEHPWLAVSECNAIPPEPPCDCFIDSVMFQPSEFNPLPPLDSNYFTMNIKINDDHYTALMDGSTPDEEYTELVALHPAIAKIFANPQVNSRMSAMTSSSMMSNVIFSNLTSECLRFEMYITLSGELHYVYVPPTDLCPSGTWHRPDPNTHVKFGTTDPYFINDRVVYPQVNAEVEYSDLLNMPESVRPTPIIYNWSDGSLFNQPIVNVYFYDASVDMAFLIGDFENLFYDKLNGDYTVATISTPLVAEDDILEEVRRKFNLIKGVSWDSRLHSDLPSDWTDVAKYPSIVRFTKSMVTKYHGVTYLSSDGPSPLYLPHSTFEMNRGPLDPRALGVMLRSRATGDLTNLTDHTMPISVSKTEALTYDVLNWSTLSSGHLIAIERLDAVFNFDDKTLTIPPVSGYMYPYVQTNVKHPNGEVIYGERLIEMNSQRVANDLYAGEGRIMGNSTRLIVNFLPCILDTSATWKIQPKGVSANYTPADFDVTQTVNSALGTVVMGYGGLIMASANDIRFLISHERYPELASYRAFELIVTIDGNSKTLEVIVE